MMIDTDKRRKRKDERSHLILSSLVPPTSMIVGITLGEEEEIRWGPSWGSIIDMFG